MGLRKRNSANKIKESKKNLAFAKLNDSPISPRKMRLVADQIRGESIDSALTILKFSPKEASRRLEKLLVSAISKLRNSINELDQKGRERLLEAFDKVNKNEKHHPSSLDFYSENCKKMFQNFRKYLRMFL